MLKPKRKALKSLLQEKVVSIGEYRNLRNGRGSRRVAIVSSDKDLFKTLEDQLSGNAELSQFESRFQLEQAIKQGEWEGVLLDERTLRDDTLTLCEKLKRHTKHDDLFVIILSTNSEKEAVRLGYEKGCDEWITQIENTTHLVRLLSQHLT